MDLESQLKILTDGVRAVKSKTIDRTSSEALLKEKGHNVNVLWDRCVSVKYNAKVPVVCLNHNTVDLYSRADIVKGKYCCDHCVIDKWTKVCNEKNYEFVSRIGKNFVSVCCMKCGHIQEDISLSQMLGTRNIDCEGCRTKLFKTNCYGAGFNYTKHERSPKGIDVHMVCQKCNSSKIACSSCITNISVKCRVCQTNSYKELLTKRNCIYVRHYAIKSLNTTKVVYINKLGDTREVSTSSLISGGFSDIENSSYTRPHSVYIMTNLYKGDMYVKIGTAGNPAKRLKTLRLDGESNVRTLHCFDNRLLAIKYESYLHKIFSDYKLSSVIASEFSNNKKTCTSVAGQHYVKSDGATEWFYPDVLNFIDFVNKDNVWQ